MPIKCQTTACADHRRGVLRRLLTIRYLMMICFFLGVAGCHDANGLSHLETHANDAAHGSTTALHIPHTFQGQRPIKICCTTGMVAELVRNVGGKRVAVTELMGAGVDPHLYKASPGDVRLLSGADAIFYSGLHLEGKMSDLLARLGNTKPAVAVAEHVDAGQRLTTAEGAVDPHVWFDVSLWREAAAVVGEALAKFDPEHAAEYARNSDRYSQQLNDLHAETMAALHAIPSERRVLVTAHDAFGYFGRAYGVEVRAIQGVNTESEAGVREINELVDFLVERKLPAVFIETSVSDRNVRALVEGTQSRGHQVTVGGELYSDALGGPETPGATYVGMVRHNVRTMVQALK